MHRSVYAPGQQRLLDLLGEKAFAAYFHERPVANEISSRADDFEPESCRRASVNACQPLTHLVGLRQRERTATRPDAQYLIAMSNRSDKGLHAVTSQCYAPSCPTRTVARMYGSGNPVGARLAFQTSVCRIGGRSASPGNGGIKSPVVARPTRP
jgi:hypothetical protein